MDLGSSLFGPTANNLNRALDRATLRYDLLSTNLSNVNVPDYKRRDVDFGIELDIAGQKLENPENTDPEIITDTEAIRLDGNSVDMEREVVEIADTQQRYEMLSEMTSRFFGGLKNVIREGK